MKNVLKIKRHKKKEKWKKNDKSRNKVFKNNSRINRLFNRQKKKKKKNQRNKRNKQTKTNKYKTQQWLILHLPHLHPPDAVLVTCLLTNGSLRFAIWRKQRLCIKKNGLVLFDIVFHCIYFFSFLIISLSLFYPFFSFNRIP